jgi:hypothetical protein
MAPSLATKLKETLFHSGGAANVYAVIDGASCENLLRKLDELAPENCCLYAGDLEADLKEVAPHLVFLKEDDLFTKWLLANFFGKAWCIFARSTADFSTVRKHFRTFLMVKSPEGETLYFRYYDPRVLSIYLPTTNEEERNIVFGPISAYYCETLSREFIQFRQNAGQIQVISSSKLAEMTNAN